MARTLLDKVWEAHTVRTLPSGQTQLVIGLHLIHEVTPPQAFQMLKELKLKVRMPERTFGTLDHITPDDRPKPPLRRPHGGGHGGAHVPEHERVRAWSGQRPSLRCRSRASRAAGPPGDPRAPAGTRRMTESATPPALDRPLAATDPAPAGRSSQGRTVRAP